jgi:septal ring factor EnvC (AmiA/AmiB activator)
MFNRSIIRKKIIILAVCSFQIIFIGATYNEIVNDKNKQLENVQKEIDKSKQDVANNFQLISDTEKETDSLNSSLNSLNDFLKDYQNETYLSAAQIAAEANSVISLEDEVNRIQNSFRNRIISLYKHGKNYELELLLSSRTPNEFLRRNQYLQKFAHSRIKELRELKSKKFILNEKKKMLTLSTSARRFYIDSKRTEKTQLEEKLKILDAKKKSLEFLTNAAGKKISRLEMEETNIKSFLNNFNDYEDDFKETKATRLNYFSDNLDSLKGNLNSPLDITLIRKDFGRNVNNATNTESFNSGVDFSVAEGSKVFAVTAGTVTLVGEVPYYGSVIIIDNGGSFRTVYSILDEVSVKPGDKVKLNQVIAKSGQNLEGQGLHFEIWKGKTPLNPREWIRM